MYNLNVNMGAGAGLLGVESSCTTPKTPEILNSLIAMTNPFDAYPPGRAAAAAAAAATGAAGAGAQRLGGGASSPGGGGGCASLGDSSNSNSSCSSQASSAGSPPPPGTSCGSGPGSVCMSPPSVQHTCSQLIKEGLKLTIQTKRRQTGRGALDPLELDAMRAAKQARKDELTAEDEERRRRRRERNKIAATKCRLKKRERTVNLVHESEILENQNHELKNQIQDLETQRRRLMEMLNMHSPNCMKNVSNNGNGSPGQSHVSIVTSQTSPTVPMPPSPYCTGANEITSSHHHQPNYCDPYHHYGSVACSFNSAYSTSGVDNGCMA